MLHGASCDSCRNSPSANRRPSSFVASAMSRTTLGRSGFLQLTELRASNGVALLRLPRGHGARAPEEQPEDPEPPPMEPLDTKTPDAGGCSGDEEPNEEAGEGCVGARWRKPTRKDRRAAGRRSGLLSAAARGRYRLLAADRRPPRLTNGWVGVTSRLFRLAPGHGSGD